MFIKIFYIIYMSINKSNLITNELIQRVMSQTTYSEEEAREKLTLFNYDYIKVIKNFMGIKQNNNVKIKSINQEIYKQIRCNLDISMKNYRENNPLNIDDVIEKIKESEQKFNNN
jgi:hypothetical protein